MKGIGEETVSSKNIQLKRREDNVPCKLDGVVVSKSQPVNASTKSDFHGSSLHRNVDASEHKDLKKTLVSFNRSWPPLNMHCSLKNAKELTAADYGDPIKVCGSHTGNSKSEGFDSHPREMDQMLSKIRQQLASAASDRQNLLVMNKRDNESLCAASARLRAAGISDITNDTLKSSMKGKKIIERNQEFQFDCGGDQDIRCKADRVNSKSPYVHNPLTSKSSSSHGGISLRDYLTPGCYERDKVRSLLLYRQLIELVDLAHSQGMFLKDARPSFFTISSCYKLSYMGSLGKKNSDLDVDVDLNKKRPLVQESSFLFRHLKQRKLDPNVKRSSSVIDLNTIDTQSMMSMVLSLEEKWYTSPEELNGEENRFKSNMYSLGVLLFELLCDCESSEMHAAMMSNLRHRILPPSFLSQNPMEAGFCLWLLHPDPSSRPTAREILQSELLCEDDSAADYETSELSLHFLSSLKEKKQKHESKLLKDIQAIEDDIKEAERRYKCHNESRQQPLTTDSVLTSNIRQLEDVYFFMRSQMNLSDYNTNGHLDKSLVKNKGRCSDFETGNNDSRTRGKCSDQIDVFFKGLCKFARYSKFETLGTIRSGDLMNSGNVICSMSFDPDEEHIAAAGISKRIKIFDVKAFMNDSLMVHYPLVEMCSKSKLSCVSWNCYIRNYLASTDYNGVVQIWDTWTGRALSQYTEHQRRAWSVDFSPIDPKKLVSGSDDSSVKLWSINEKGSIGTIRSPANVCCVQFSPFFNHLLTFGSADHKVYCYDLRHVRIPWCTLAGHDKTVSYVKFMDSDTIVSASTDSSLKLWNLNNTNSSGLSSSACSLTYQGHTNQKNFVGLSVLDTYIACGSETNEVYGYHRSFPMPIASYKFGGVDPVTGKESWPDDDSGQFVSSVCERRESNMLVAANSTGTIKLLKLV